MRGTAAGVPVVTWLGGGLFVASLAYFSWWYFLHLDGASPEEPALPAIAVNAALFTVFALHHSLMARSGAKRWLARRVPAHLERTWYVWDASLLFFAVCLLWRDVPGVFYAHTGVMSLPHWAVVLAGVWLTARSAAVIDPLDLAGMRQASGQDAPLVFKAAGPYGVVRHPIYLGWLLMVFGVPEMNGTRLTFALVSSLYLVLAIPFEERSLVEAPGGAYRSYQAQVRWRLIPGVW
jgi:protein-S-isoprenylcysteine O-methyltransferase Ste14